MTEWNERDERDERTEPSEPSGSPEWTAWTEAQAAEWIVHPVPSDDKYSRGVLGVVTGSERYPGAAVIGVEAAARTGVGMIRYLGAALPTSLVLQRRPEVVTATGRVQAWLVGSGLDADVLTGDEAERIVAALRSEVPTIADAGALRHVVAARAVRAPGTAPAAERWDEDEAWRIVVTPHAGELVRMLGDLGIASDVASVHADPVGSAVQVASALGVVVVLKGAVTHVAAPDGSGITVTGGPAWLATAGSGDALGGILGALLATNASRIAADRRALVGVAATAAMLHALAGRAEAANGPLVALDVAEAVRGVVASLIADVGSSGRPVGEPVGQGEPPR
ncbi:ADP-dependent NAD(P)H-hydrate dehydratase [Plantibacter sp. Mn2098]|uniref:ADP-dependent NAD(P)H-hydrate dehydratase n=1 Tax=Plantibacter sp. Mn2098 TaxID=3395266 RepID=UPI003BCF78A1